MPPGSASRRFFDVRRVDSVDSTNSLAAALARGGAANGLVVVAEHQTAGRGRLDRRWSAPPGSSLLVSVLLREGPSGTAAGPLAGLAMGLAAAWACGVVARVRPGLKWPNDLVVDDGKLGGVLGEVVGPDAVVVGLGLNVNWGDERPPDGGVSLDALAGRSVDRDVLLAAVLVELEARLEAEPQQLVDDYRAWCTTLGRDVRVELGDGVLEGEAVGITPEGHLILDCGGRPRVVAAGDVTHVRPG